MSVSTVSAELAELVAALGSSWFAHTLPGVLQKVFAYDYFLLALYERDRPIRIVRSDFRDVQIQRALDHLVSETYVIEPIRRLFQARRIEDGVHEMTELVARSRKLPDPIDLSLPHLIVDRFEEIGWRTRGWPEYQQETCVLVTLADGRLAAISLYNFGLVQDGPAPTDRLVAVYSLLAAIVRRHFELVLPSADPAPGLAPQLGSSYEQAVSGAITRIAPDHVVAFFAETEDVVITAREAELFSLLLEGDTLAAIADRLRISVLTARTHRRNVYRKLGHGRLLQMINQFHAWRSDPRHPSR